MRTDRRHLVRSKRSSRELGRYYWPSWRKLEMRKTKELKEQGARAYIAAMTAKFPGLKGDVRHDLAAYGDVGVLMDVPPTLLSHSDDLSEESAAQTRRLAHEVGVYVLPTWIPPFGEESTAVSDELVIAGKTF